MLAEDGVNVRAFHHPRGNELARAAGHRVLARLKDELDGTGELVAHMAERLGRAEQHRRVQVVAAGVHDALVHAGKRKAGLLMDGQRVDIGTEGDALAGAFGAVDQADDGGGQRLLNLIDAHLLQLTADQGTGAHLGHADLGVGMDVTADGNQLIKNTFYKTLNLRHNSILLSGCTQN